MPGKGLTDSTMHTTIRLEPIEFKAASNGGSYYERERPDVVAAVRRCGKAGRILDVGCGGGTMGAAILRAGLVDEVVGLEKHPAAAELAASRLTSVVVGDAVAYSPADGRLFGGAVLADVLEHQIDPDALLRHVARLVIAGGWVIVSLPNVGHFRVIASLILGDWTYGDEGILDRTHLRFFTWQSGLQLVDHAGLLPQFAMGVMTARGVRTARALPWTSRLLATQLIIGCRRPV